MLFRGEEYYDVLMVTFYTTLATPTVYKICVIKHVTPWGCHLLTLPRTGWDLCPDRPFRARECGCGHSYPKPAAMVTLLLPQSHLPQSLPQPLHSRPTDGRERQRRLSAGTGQEQGKRQCQCGLLSPPGDLLSKLKPWTQVRKVRASNLWLGWKADVLLFVKSDEKVNLEGQKKMYCNEMQTLWQISR